MGCGERNEIWPQLVSMETKISETQVPRQGRAKEEGKPDPEPLQNKDTHLAGDGHDEDPPRLTVDEAQDHRDTSPGGRATSGRGGSKCR